jgi:hypothetical protein
MSRPAPADYRAKRFAYISAPPDASCLLARPEPLTSGSASRGAPALITFDDQNPTMFGYTGQVTVKGYDNMTGVGTPRGQSFIRALRKIEK